METTELERNYRAACQKMLASLDLRSALNRINEELGRSHQSLTIDGAQILSDPAVTDESIGRYRAMVENVVAKLDQRDQLRQRDGFKEALQDLLHLGEQLGYARKAEPAVSFEPKAAPRAVIVQTPAKHPPAEEGSAFGSVEKELAELQQQLVQFRQS